MGNSDAQTDLQLRVLLIFDGCNNLTATPTHLL